MARRDWESWDPGLISSLAQWVKDLVLPQLWLRSDHWPVSSKCYGAAKKKKKKKLKDQKSGRKKQLKILNMWFTEVMKMAKHMKITFFIIK